MMIKIVLASEGRRVLRMQRLLDDGSRSQLAEECARIPTDVKFVPRLKNTAVLRESFTNAQRTRVCPMLRSNYVNVCRQYAPPCSTPRDLDAREQRLLLGLVAVDWKLVGHIFWVRHLVLLGLGALSAPRGEVPRRQHLPGQR